jgi:tRNA A37 threonylcarbamoyladenosine biosynthesis protein TsaE
MHCVLLLFADKMAGLIDFQTAFQEDICLIEWPSKMPAGVMALPRK